MGFRAPIFLGAFLNIPQYSISLTSSRRHHTPAMRTYILFLITHTGVARTCDAINRRNQWRVITKEFATGNLVLSLAESRHLDDH